MENEQTAAVETLRSMLDALAKVRAEKKGWFDAEEEEVSGTQVFKIGEALRPFIMVAAQQFNPPIKNPLPKNILMHDTKAFFAGIEKQGFFPSPYPAVESNDQYMDFAAFALEFSELVYRSQEMDGAETEKIRKSAKNCFNKALDFLTDSKHYIEDEAGVRWAGTSTHSRATKKGNVTVVFSNTYFTALVVSALNRAKENANIPLSEEKKSLVADLTRKAGKWLAARENKGLLSGDEKKEDQQLLNTTLGVKALAETYHEQDSSVRNVLKAVAAAYIRTLKDLIASRGVTITQNYIYVYSSDVETSLQYEERQSWAGMLLAC